MFCQQMASSLQRDSVPLLSAPHPLAYALFPERALPMLVCSCSLDNGLSLNGTGRYRTESHGGLFLLVYPFFSL